MPCIYLVSLTKREQGEIISIHTSSVLTPANIKRIIFWQDLIYRCIDLKAANASVLVVTAVLLFCLYYGSNLMLSAFASPSSPTLINSSVPSAESVYTSESMKIPPSVGTFVILIPNESHENWSDEKHKLISDRNSYYVPTNLAVPNGTSIVFLHADAPWDTPNPHTTEIQDSAGNVVYSTGQLDYAQSSEPVVLPSPGIYNIVDKSYDTKESRITVLDNETSTGDLIVGGFYTPTNQVANTKDNDGVSHPGSLQYYSEAFKRDGFEILSEYNFTYATCDYCDPGGYWPDNKSGDHTLLIYSTQQPLTSALAKLVELVRDNVYI
jgi:hypothetical protein